ncbi:type II toxin-antitoxin system VapC family toxin [Acidicapsa acidisoli]|uniref:type II toxin-antitoxin system VapC family toxin n=1 Tax=Acidicapsa acidisoli TaxID=1615681 RepID=UPI0021DF66BE|nr:type II toxin-antitoxin system VapC family toxin [Acidicapsa acidisoli]
MPYVLDASVTITWAMPDEEHPVATLAYAQLDFESAIVPPIWCYEVRNILLVNERRQRISQMDSTRFLRQLDQFSIETDNAPNHSNLLHLARQHRLTVYDAAYLELAQRHGVPLATLDKALWAAAKAAGIPLLA